MSVTAAEGFIAAGCHAGVKRRRFDLALLATEDRQPVTAAAVFTQNKFFAPPIAASRGRLSSNGGQAAAIIVNSGNANAGTGAPGLADAEAMCDAAADALGLASADVLVCSTGIIGTPLPIEKIVAAVPALAADLSSAGGAAAAKAILTTDHRPKEAVISGSNFTLGGMAKGCGMIAPNMATMLAFLTTDAEIDRGQFQDMLKVAVDATFNTLNVDGATSTNDSVIALANGRRGKPDPAEFADALQRLCADLTLQMAMDAEGMTKIVTLSVTGAASDAEARAAAKSIAENNLVKCSWYGSDPYWGRLLAAAGSAGVEFAPDRATVSYGNILVSTAGTSIPHDEAAVAELVRQTRFDVEVALGVGNGTAQVIGIDLGPGYIKENSKTS
ncbi:MAG TPA: bifunctional glutamate N-acetyltransferase/amino-acid acetyltransferase ArgJ [Sphingomicrobium sp.]|nr:bifunctional glutamate N-acetyltransferase/amino-acid acetyltransferase ArgJ [Sphingomicrobium sp.]